MSRFLGQMIGRPATLSLATALSNETPQKRAFEVGTIMEHGEPDEATAWPRVPSSFAGTGYHPSDVQRRSRNASAAAVVTAMVAPISTKLMAAPNGQLDACRISAATTGAII